MLVGLGVGFLVGVAVGIKILVYYLTAGRNVSIRNVKSFLDEFDEEEIE